MNDAQDWLHRYRVEQDMGHVDEAKAKRVRLMDALAMEIYVGHVGIAADLAFARAEKFLAFLDSLRMVREACSK